MRVLTEDTGFEHLSEIFVDIDKIAGCILLRCICSATN